MQKSILNNIVLVSTAIAKKKVLFFYNYCIIKLSNKLMKKTLKGLANEKGNARIITKLAKQPYFVF